MVEFGEPAFKFAPLKAEETKVNVATPPEVSEPVTETALQGRDRRRGFSVTEQMRLLVPLLVVWSFGFAALSLVALHSDVGELLLDPNWLNGAAWYTGAISQIGAAVWTTAGVAAAGGGWVARSVGRHEAATFLHVGAVATVVLLIDDLFAVHAVLPQLGIPKQVAQAAVVVPVAVWLVRFRRDIQRTRSSILFAAVLANAGSLVIDVFLHPDRNDFAVLFEDGCKFLGALAWATYFVATARDIVLSSLWSSRGAPTRK